MFNVVTVRVLLTRGERDENDRPTPPMMTLADFEPPPEARRIQEQRQVPLIRLP
jgi:hypothetical protein